MLLKLVFKRWVSLYRLGKMRVPIGTNNGVERQNKMLKECHLKFQVDKSLSGLLKVLHHDFFPEALKKYTNGNTLASDSYRLYKVVTPSYLHNRPQHVVHHCMKRICNALAISFNDIVRVDTSSFTVRSSCGILMYDVYLGNESDFPRCTCPDFKYYFLPCKHMFAIFSKYNDVSWASLPTWYTDSVYITLDREVITTLGFSGTSKDPTAESTDTTTPEHIELSLVDPVEIPKAKPTLLSSDDNKPSKQTIKQMVERINRITNILYDVASQQALLLLHSVEQNLVKSCRHEEGIRVSKPPLSLKTKKRKLPSSFVCDELPRKHPKPNKYQGRHGSVANSMSSLHAVTGLQPKQTENSPNVIGGPQNSNNQKLTNLGKILPCYTLAEKHLTNKALQCGPYSVTYLQLLSLEMNISSQQKQEIWACDKRFRVGWLYDEIIDSYLWCLCQNNKQIMFADSAVAQCMKSGLSVKRLWANMTLENMKFIFIPYNPSRIHWVLLVVDIKKKQLLYLDPRKHALNLPKQLETTKLFLNNVLHSKFGFKITTIDTMLTSRTFQNDFMSCGAIICMYASWLTESKPLLQPDVGLKESREHILSTIAHESSLDINVCGSCRNQDENITDWVQCTKCPQWFHVNCVGLNINKAKSNKTFTCSHK
ncbi:uncharacterized protein LOC113474043 isoform X2 [Ciona intestinalis]